MSVTVRKLDLFGGGFLIVNECSRSAAESEKTSPSWGKGKRLIREK